MHKLLLWNHIEMLFPQQYAPLLSLRESRNSIHVTAIIAKGGLMIFDKSPQFLFDLLLFDYTFRVFVKVRYVHALVWANGLGADKMTHNLLLTVDLTKSPICIPLPVDFITVHLNAQQGEQESGLWNNIESWWKHCHIWCFLVQHQDTTHYLCYFSLKKKLLSIVKM